MPRRVNFIVFLGVITVLIAATGIGAGAAPQGEIQTKEAEIEAAQDRLMEIRMEAGAAHEAYNNALYEMNQLNGQVANAEDELEAAEKRVAEAEKDLEERASQIYRSGNVAFMDVLVGVDNFSEFATRMNLWVRILEQEQAEFEAVREARNDLAAQKDKLEAERARRVGAVKEAADHKERSASAEEEAQAYLNSLNSDLRDALEAEQQRRAEVAAARAAEQVQASAPAPEIEVTEVKAPSVPKANLEDKQAAAERAAAAEAAAAEAERQARLAAEEAAAQRKAAEQAAAEREAARRAAARKDARQEAKEQAKLAEQRAAERQAAREEAERQAQLAAEQAAIERAAAQQAAAERRAAERAAERRAAREAAAQEAAERRAAREAAAQEAVERRAAREAAAERAAERRPAREATAEEDRLQEERRNARRDSSPSASASASPSPESASRGSGRPSASAGAVLGEGRRYLGTPYLLGGLPECVPFETMDCSCFTMTVFSEFGIALPDSPGAQMGYGTPVNGSPAAGDLLFWSEDGSGVITHVGIAMGDGTTIHASVYDGAVVQGTPINSIPGYAGARRVL